MTSPPGRHCRNRRFEWGMAFALFFTGAEFVGWPNSLPASKLQFMLDIVSSSSFTAYYLFFGILRLTALFLNGEGKPWTAYARVIGAIAGGFAWFQMAASLIIAQLAVAGPPSPTVPLLLVLVAVEIDSAIRAAHDARSR